jgi:DNA invertase Pin-like site-specific DNA recombinase
VDYAYARVSTQDQDLTVQLAALEQAGIHPSRIFREKISGVAKRLPVRDQVLAQLQAGDRLTVWKLDRLGRSLVELLAVVQDLEARKIAFRCTTQPIDTSTPAGRAFLQLLAVFAEFERQIILERTAAGKARRKAEGRHPGGPRMFGFAAATLDVIPEEQELVREAADRVLAGEPMNQVVDDWHTRGLRPIRGQRWKVVSLRRLLLNPRVVEIIGQDQHQDLVRLFSRPGRQSLGRPAAHLLSGILACPCGQPLYGAQKGGKDRPAQLVYRCKKGGNSGGRFAGCGSTVVSMRRADAWAGDAFVAAVAGPDFARAMAQRQREILDQDMDAAELDDAREEIQDLEQVQGTRYYSDTMRERHAQLRRMVDAATARLMAAPELEEMLSLPRSEAKLRELWAGWDTASRRRWLRRILDRIEVMPATSRTRASDVESRMAPVWKI